MEKKERKGGACPVAKNEDAKQAVITSTDGFSRHAIEGVPASRQREDFLEDRARTRDSIAAQTALPAMYAAAVLFLCTWLVPNGGEGEFYASSCARASIENYRDSMLLRALHYRRLLVKSMVFN